MHGLVNTALQRFVCDTYGIQAWQAVTARAGVGHVSFEAMLSYDMGITDAIIDAAAAHLRKPRDSLLEDVGTYLVSHPDVPGPRRLLRFAGATFEEFLYSLEDLPDRVRLAVPELDVPQIRLCEDQDGRIRVVTEMLFDGYGHVLVGLLRAMSDEYGALSTIEQDTVGPDEATIAIGVHVHSFREGRDFRLGAGIG